MTRAVVLGDATFADDLGPHQPARMRFPLRQFCRGPGQLPSRSLVSARDALQIETFFRDLQQPVVPVERAIASSDAIDHRHDFSSSSYHPGCGGACRRSYCRLAYKTYAKVGFVANTVQLAGD